MWEQLLENELQHYYVINVINVVLMFFQSFKASEEMVLLMVWAENVLLPRLDIYRFDATITIYNDDYDGDINHIDGDRAENSKHRQ